MIIITLCFMTKDTKEPAWVVGRTSIIVTEDHLTNDEAVCQVLALETD